MKCVIYTDGSSTLTKTKPDGCGGIAFVVVDREEKEVFRFKNVYLGTSAACELYAGLCSLRWAIENGYDGVTVHSDSSYFVNSFNNWIHGWKRREWKARNGEEIANVEIIKELYEIKQILPSKAAHVKGHNGNKWNELVDQLANEARLSCG